MLNASVMQMPSQNTSQQNGSAAQTAAQHSGILHPVVPWLKQSPLVGHPHRAHAGVTAGNTPSNSVTAMTEKRHPSKRQHRIGALLSLQVHRMQPRTPASGQDLLVRLPG